MSCVNTSWCDVGMILDAFKNLNFAKKKLGCIDKVLGLCLSEGVYYHRSIARNWKQNLSIRPMVFKPGNSLFPERCLFLYEKTCRS